jgi:hypothetical protein
MPCNHAKRTIVSRKIYQTNFAAAQKARQEIRPIVEQELKKLDTDGVFVANLDIVIAARFPFWPTDLAKLLCNDPSLAKLPNKQLVLLIKDASGESGMSATRLSEKLSTKATAHVEKILKQHGYATDTLICGTDIKRIVKKDIRRETQKKEVIEFFHDSLEFMGTRHSYKQRRRVKGDRLLDLRIRMDGSDIPLSVVLRLTGIETSHFRAMDKQACEFASRQHSVPTATACKHRIVSDTEHVVDTQTYTLDDGDTEVSITDPSDLSTLTVTFDKLTGKPILVHSEHTARQSSP